MGYDTKWYYTATLRCLNCGHIWEESIDMGLLVPEHIKAHGVKCTNCKCEDAKIIPDGRID